MKWQQHQKRFKKMLTYILERRPDEFGLVPDADGFVGLKTLLKALNEEAGWRHVRRHQIEQLVVGHARARFEIAEHRIRCRQREHLPQKTISRDPPGLLYGCIRQRAYPKVHDQGVHPAGTAGFTLAVDKAMALRMGRRSDNHPVLLTVHTGLAQEQGSRFFRYGDLFIVDTLQPGTFTGPPLPPERPQERDAPPEKLAPKTPGSFPLSPPKKPGREGPRPGAGGRASRRRRRDKSKNWSREKPPWRR